MALRIPRMPEDYPTRPNQPTHPVGQGVTEAEREREARIIVEHNFALLKIQEEVLGPVSVREIEDVVKEMEDTPAMFAKRLILQRRQLRRNADKIQVLMVNDADKEERLKRAEETLSRFRANEVV